MKVSINRDGCIGCGLCANICPEVFQMADDGLSEICGEPSAENADSVQEAANSCPVEVISVD